MASAAIATARFHAGRSATETAIAARAGTIFNRLMSPGGSSDANPPSLVRLPAAAWREGGAGLNIRHGGSH